jgi:hypothetical protein
LPREYVQSESTLRFRQFPIYLVSSDGIVANSQVGTAQIWVAGSAAWTNCATVPIEVGNGFYVQQLTAGELGNLGEFAIRFKGSAALEFNMDGQVVGYSPYTSSVLVGSIAASVVNSAAFGSFFPQIIVASVQASVVNSQAFGAFQPRVIVASMETGVIRSVAVESSAANRIADHVWRRTYANARTSADGDAVAFRSPLGMVGKMVNRWATSGSTLIIYQEDDLTSTAPGGTQTITSTAGAEPITSLDT